MTVAKAKGKTRQDRRLVEMSGAATPKPEPRRDTYTDETVLPITCDLAGHEAQIVQAEVRDMQSGQLVRFTVMLQVRESGTDEGWMDVERVDCAHGFVHVDQVSRAGKKGKRTDLVPAKCRESLDDAIKWAVTYIWSVEERLTRW